MSFLEEARALACILGSSFLSLVACIYCTFWPATATEAYYGLPSLFPGKKKRPAWTLSSIASLRREIDRRFHPHRGNGLRASGQHGSKWSNEAHSRRFAICLSFTFCCESSRPEKSKNGSSTRSRALSEIHLCTAMTLLQQTSSSTQHQPCPQEISHSSTSKTIYQILAPGKDHQSPASQVHLGCQLFFCATEARQF